MDNKNVFVAIALSMSVLLFWGLFLKHLENQLLKKMIKILKKELSKALLLRQLVSHKLLKSLREKTL